MQEFFHRLNFYLCKLLHKSRFKLQRIFSSIQLIVDYDFFHQSSLYCKLRAHDMCKILMVLVVSLGVADPGSGRLELAKCMDRPQYNIWKNYFYCVLWQKIYPAANAHSKLSTRCSKH